MSHSETARHALFPGTFDPLTLGHVDLVRRACQLFGRVTVGIAHNAAKKTLFSAEERVQLAREALRGLEGVEVVLIEGLSVHAAERIGAHVLVRGVRSGTDFDFEVQMALTNRAMLPRIDTVFFVPAPEFAHVSSTLVRQIAELAGDPAPFVPGNVAKALAKKLGR
ncbi:MAG: pantetheine-phosphate adenylyltransferase [Planctomycetes bacterium]|nr:pantetheine-phosphate adenylyltransferase [Planctomycetota bacterium]